MPERTTSFLNKGLMQHNLSRKYSSGSLLVESQLVEERLVSGPSHKEDLKIVTLPFNCHGFGGNDYKLHVSAMDTEQNLTWCPFGGIGIYI